MSAAPRFRPPLLAFAWDLAVLCCLTMLAPRSRWVIALTRAGRGARAEGLEHIPAEGAFVLALNHHPDGATGAVVLAALRAIARARPALIERVLVVGGRGALGPPKSRAQSLLRSIGRLWVRAFRRRWREHFAVISMARTQPDYGSLRAWKREAASKLSVVYPEGVARETLGPMREGSGRWLATMDVPTIPCAVWWDGARWQVRFGAPVHWARRSALRDPQLGLAIAAMLPEPLQGGWRLDLQRLRERDERRARETDAPTA